MHMCIYDNVCIQLHRHAYRCAHTYFSVIYIYVHTHMPMYACLNAYIYICHTEVFPGQQRLLFVLWVLGLQ